MAIAIGNRSQLGYVMETTYGVTPATPALIELPVTSSSVQLTREEYEDNSIRPDRMERYSISGNKQVGGTLDANFSHGVFDDMLSSLMQSTWATNVLKTGTTRQSFTLEEAHFDTNQFIVSNGCVVDKFSLNVPSSGVVTASFDIIGLNQAPIASSSVDTVSGYTPASVRTPFSHVGSAGFVKEGGTTFGYVTAYTLSVDNGLERLWSISSDTAIDIITSRAAVTGTITVHFTDSVMYNKFINGTASSLDLKLDDGSHTVEFFLPNIKYTGATKTVATGGIQLSMPFKALFDSTSNSNLVITRSA